MTEFDQVFKRWVTKRVRVTDGMIDEVKLQVVDISIRVIVGRFVYFVRGCSRLAESWEIPAITRAARSMP